MLVGYAISSSDSSRLSSIQSNVVTSRATPKTTADSGDSVSSLRSNNKLTQLYRDSAQLDRANFCKRPRKGPEHMEGSEGEEVVTKRVRKPTKVSERKPRGKREAEQELDSHAKVPANEPAPTTSHGNGRKVFSKATSQPEFKEDGMITTKTKRKRKTKEEKEAEAMPLAARSMGAKVLVGAHVSSAGGVHNAILNSVHIGGNAMALFLKSQRKWKNPPLQDEHLAAFLSNCKQHNYSHHDHAIPPIVPHGSYLVNLAHPDPARTKQSYDAFLDDLQRCSKLGIGLYNFHPGNCGASESRGHAITHLAKQLNKAHKDPLSGNVITLLETMTGSKNILGISFEDLAEIIAQIDNKERIGVCLDTCHVFAAGYDLRTPEAFNATLDEFDRTVGLKYLKALHMNDSKAPLNSGRDLHARIGTGFLGLRSFHNIMNESRFWGLPMVLETPIETKDAKTGREIQEKSIWTNEIKLLESLVGMDVDGEEFKKIEVDLFAKGVGERDRIQAQVDKRGVKDEKKARTSPNRSAKRKAKQAVDTSEDEQFSGDEKI